MASSQPSKPWPIINVVDGDITETAPKKAPPTKGEEGKPKEVHLIVNPADETLCFAGEVSKALLKKDSDIQRKSQGKISDMETKEYCIVDFTANGRETILCMNIDSSSPSVKKLARIFENSFPELKESKVTVMTIPVIGAGVSKMPPKQAANMVVDSLCLWFDQQGEEINQIDTINVIAFKPDIKGHVETKVDEKLKEVHGGIYIHNVHWRWGNVIRDSADYNQAIDRAKGSARTVLKVQKSEPITSRETRADDDGCDGYPVIYQDGNGQPEFRVFFKTR